MTRKVIKLHAKAYGNNNLQVIDEFTANIATKYNNVVAEVFVVKNKGASLLSRDTATQLQILKIDTNMWIVNENNKIGKVAGFEVSLQIDDKVKPVQHTKCHVPIPLQEKVQSEIDHLLEQDIIETAPRDSPWISRLVISPKAGDPVSVRLCVNMRAANKAIVPQHYPLPTFDDIVPHLHNCKWFSKIDLTKAFHQVVLAKECRFITTFATHQGYYRYKRLTFGMNCASEVFQSIIERVLKGIKCVRVFIDDIVVFGPTKQQHDDTLRDVINRLKEFGLTTNHKKCELGRSEVVFMGHILSADGIRPTWNKVDAIRRLRELTTVEEVRSFLDASPTGLGGVLLQEKDGLKRVICYISKGLSDAEKSYAQNENEALALVWATERLQIYLRGMEFLLLTDHEPLKIQALHYLRSLWRSITFGNALTIEEMSKHTVSDPILAEVNEALQTGRWNDAIKKFTPFKDELYCCRELLLRGERLIVPNSLQKRVLRLAHIGHPGIERSKQRLRSKVWWPTMDRDVEKARTTRTILGPLPSGESLLVIIDPYSRYKVIEVMRQTTTSDIIARLRPLFMRLGVPKILLTDNARNFTSNEMEDFCGEFGLTLRHTTPYWPQANGEVERQNRNILNILRIAELNQSDWKKDLEEYNYVYALTSHPATGYSPAEILFGRKFRDWIPQLSHSSQGLNDEVRDNDRRYKFKSKVHYDAVKRTKESNLRIDDRVLMKNLNPANKLTPTFHSEPARVVQKQGNSIVVETPAGQRYRRNSSHLKKLQTQECTETDHAEEDDVEETLEWSTPLNQQRESPGSESGKRTPSVPEPDLSSTKMKRQIRKPLRFDDYVLDEIHNTE
ncbi:uncharacterized protein K02A2.6-like [Toxorhynchites rutilus septentrionalis]|uniref:uncharacterized protein K02A2.6-like n=1 Tax=Toxorhynchites rutilus septentrionalis TaxID=329112 RepID=UPI0024796F8A|nr:uncharacterized protein K02A2.6-like [Toxorhynchites rutilus septentrionalis]